MFIEPNQRQRQHWASSGSEVPQESVVTRAPIVRLDPVGIKETLFPAGPVVPCGTPSGDGEVGPSVGESEAAEIHMAGAVAVVIQEGIGGAGVAVADDESIDGWRVGESIESFVDIEMLVVGMPPPGF